MTDRIFSDCCYGTEAQHPAGQPCQDAHVIARHLYAALSGTVAAWDRIRPSLPCRIDIEDAEWDEFDQARAALEAGAWLKA